MKWPCALGFRCPHACLDDEGMILCICPETEADEDKAYGFADDWVVCPLMESGPLATFVCDYNEANDL